jgi:predicted HTH transcriptional regulator
MDIEFLESLIYGTEGTLVDFKETFLFNDHFKSGFIKDMIAFANSHRDQDAYLLIGVKDQGIGEDSVVDISDLNLDDAKFRDLINAYTTLPIKYEFSLQQVFGKYIGVFQIPPSTNRFHLITKDYVSEQKKLLTEGQGWIREGAQNRSLNGHDSLLLREQILNSKQKDEPKLRIIFDDEQKETHKRLYYQDFNNKVVNSVRDDELEERYKEMNTVQIPLYIENYGKKPAENYQISLSGTGIFINNKNELKLVNSKITHGECCILGHFDIYFLNDNGDYSLDWKIHADNMPDDITGQITFTIGRFLRKRH